VASFSEHESDDLAKYGARIASSSDSDSEDNGSEVRAARSNSIDAEDEYRDKFNLSRDLSPSPSSAPSQTLEPPSRAKTLERSSSLPSKSTFLPSLTMGGYWSGSESAPEDDVEIAPKKNRRGQRARQQLWEKKYGASAKHLQKQKNNDRNRGWDLQRGAQSDDGRYRKRIWKQGNMLLRRSSTQKSVASDANKIEVNRRRSRPRDDTGLLHPSWQAAKLAKEKKQSASFQGKKTVFD
jgi:BUD22